MSKDLIATLFTIAAMGSAVWFLLCIDTFILLFKSIERAYVKKHLRILLIQLFFLTMCIYTSYKLFFYVIYKG